MIAPWLPGSRRGEQAAPGLTQMVAIDGWGIPKKKGAMVEWKCQRRWSWKGMLGLEAWSGKHTWVGGAELRLWLASSSSSDPGAVEGGCGSFGGGGVDAKGAAMNRGCSKQLPSVAVAAARGNSRCIPPQCVPGVGWAALHSGFSYSGIHGQTSLIVCTGLPSMISVILHKPKCLVFRVCLDPLAANSYLANRPQRILATNIASLVQIVK
jgi:hypothetical protein